MPRRAAAHRPSKPAGDPAHAAGLQPPEPLLDALLLRVSVLLPELGPSEVVQVTCALVDLQYRPSDAWLTAFVAQVRCAA